MHCIFISSFERIRGNWIQVCYIMFPNELTIFMLYWNIMLFYIYGPDCLNIIKQWIWKKWYWKDNLWKRKGNKLLIVYMNIMDEVYFVTKPRVKKTNEYMKVPKTHLRIIVLKIKSLQITNISTRKTLSYPWQVGTIWHMAGVFNLYYSDAIKGLRIIPLT